MNKNHYVAIMAGGIGSRFWPMSRIQNPKQFLDILQTGSTLLQSTFERFKTFIPLENIYIVTSGEYVPLVKEQLPQLPEANILGEPDRRNTAPCIAYVSMKIEQLNPEANLIVAPSDHMITDVDTFRETCLEALNFTAKENAFVTLGIKPTYPNTGYGYIQFEKSTLPQSIYPVKRFTEKPDKTLACSFLQSGSYLWNSGIFIWKAKDILEAFRCHAPEMFELFAGHAAYLNTPKENVAILAIYAKCESISIDYAIMEKAGNVFVIPSAFRWSDLGTWNSAWENFEKDPMQNAIAGDNTIMAGASGCLVHSMDKKLILVGGVKDLIIVNTADALMICKKEDEQQIREYVRQVSHAKGEMYL